MIAWFARHQTAANLLMAAIMILGLVSLSGLQRETFPEIENEVNQIIADAPAKFMLGASCTLPADIDWGNIKVAMDAFNAI